MVGAGFTAAAQATVCLPPRPKLLLGLAANAAERTPFALFDLEQDLGETRDLSAEQPEI